MTGDQIPHPPTTVISNPLGARGVARGASKFVLLPVAAALLLAGCGSPNAANIELRKQLQSMQAQVDDLTAQHARDTATITADAKARPDTPTLPADKLNQLFTTHGLKFNSLTGGNNPNSIDAPDTQLQVAVSPIDEAGTPIKAAGTFKIQAFDLANTQQPLVGTWDFDLPHTRDRFFSQLGSYGYVLICPLVPPPLHANLTIRAEFTDALTGRVFVEQTTAAVRLAH